MEAEHVVSPQRAVLNVESTYHRLAGCLVKEMSSREDGASMRAFNDVRQVASAVS
jgi:hypothetical protein